jgi:hypothetical protein
LEKKMKSANTSNIIDLDRCQHRTPSGRRCKLPIEGPGKVFCYTHIQELMKADALSLKNALLTNHEGFQTAQGINFALTNLYKLLAGGYLSPRRAAVLAFINSLQLRTLPAIDADNEAGIIDPTAPEELETTPADAPAASSTSAATSTDATSAATSTAAPAAAYLPCKGSPSKGTAQTPAAWDLSIPEPDPTKKPS